MPHALVKQPNGKYAIWSSVVDTFLTVDCTAEEVLIEEIDSTTYWNYQGCLREDLCKELENIGRKGRAWAWAPTWDEALETIRELHGADAVTEIVKLAELAPAEQKAKEAVQAEMAELRKQQPQPTPEVETVRVPCVVVDWGDGIFVVSGATDEANYELVFVSARAACMNGAKSVFEICVDIPLPAVPVVRAEIVE